MTAQAACSSAVTRASATASIPSDYLALYQKWGSAYGVPWQLLAAVGSVESRHGRDPGAYVPHTRGVLGPMQFQAGIEQGRQARRRRRRPGLRRHMGDLPQVLGPPAVPHGRPDDEIAAAAAKLAYDSASGTLWPRALWRYNALHSYRKTVLRRAARLGMNSACGLLRQSEQASVSPRRASPTAAPSRSNLQRALAATPESLLADDSLAFAPAAADDIAHHVADTRLVALLAWIAQRHGIVVTVIKTGHARYVAGTHKESNHWYGRAATISEVDGRPVSPGSQAAAALWNELHDGARGRSGPTRSALRGRARPIRAGSRAPTSRRRCTSASTPSAPRRARRQGRRP